MIIPHLTQVDSPWFSKNNTGLGNALFQIFAAYGLSKKYNHIFDNSNLKTLMHILKNNFNLDHENTIYRNLKVYNYVNNTNICPIKENPNLYSGFDNNIDQFIKNNSNSTIYLMGYLQSHKYFDKYYEEICELIKPDLKSFNIIETTYPYLFDTNVINISIHSRLNWGCGIKYNTNYLFYFEAINYIKTYINKDINNTHKKIIINIFSDNIIEFKNTFNYLEDECIFYENNMDYIDMWCMSLCNHNILSKSTLSWWGAYINTNKDKIVVYPNDILRLHMGTIYNSRINTERTNEHYKPEWVGLDTPNVIYQV
jgi:hypothetical protein